MLQHATEAGLTGPGALIRIAHDGTRTVLASEGLIKPTAIIAAPFDAEEDNNEEEHDAGAGELTFYLELWDVRGERRGDGEWRGHPAPAVRGRHAPHQRRRGVLPPEGAVACSILFASGKRLYTLRKGSDKAD